MSKKVDRFKGIVLGSVGGAVGVLAVLLWGLANELAVPLLGLSEGPTASPPQLHAHTLPAHIAYGLATSASIQVLEALI